MKAIVLLAAVSIIAAAAIVPAVRTARPQATQPAARRTPAFDCEAQAAPMLFAPVVFVPPRVGLPFLPLIYVPLEIGWGEVVVIHFPNGYSCP
jgi:hypothetical protein